MLHQDERSMSSTPPHFPLLCVLHKSLLVQAMSHYLKTIYHPSFIQTYLSHLKSESRTVCCIRIPKHKATCYQSYKTISDIQDPQEPSRIKNTEFCPMPRDLDPSTIKGNLGCCTRHSDKPHHSDEFRPSDESQKRRPILLQSQVSSLFVTITKNF